MNKITIDLTKLVELAMSQVSGSIDARLIATMAGLQYQTTKAALDRGVGL